MHSQSCGRGRKEDRSPVRSTRHWSRRTVGARRSGSCQRSPRVQNSWVSSWRMSKRGSRFYLLPSLHMQSYSQYFLRFLSLGTVALGGPTLLWGGAVLCVVDWWAASSASTPETTENVAKCVRGAHFLPIPVENHCVNWCRCSRCSFSFIFARTSLCVVQLEKPTF